MDSVLIIDDDEATRIALQSKLEEENFLVFTAENGQEGLEKLALIPKPILIILDLMMPIMDGWEFLEMRKKDPSVARIPVMVISSFFDQAKNIKADDFIKKPVDLNLLSEKIKKLQLHKVH